ncbi:MAG: hypothetical protein NT119_08030, partial [Actinobacteria bacterium]|nr:hypothetical protein [Actinomycetota bacterium]
MFGLKSRKTLTTLKIDQSALTGFVPLREILLGITRKPSRSIISLCVVHQTCTATSKPASHAATAR